MKLFFLVTKKGLAAVLSAVIVLFILASWTVSLKLTAIDGSTHEKRAHYIKSLGYEINEKDITSKETVIPSEFGEVYSNYNKIQRQAGFDLSDYKGKNVTVYTYPLWENNKNLNLIVYEGKIIGGDVCDTAFDGEMKPLK